jgi:hypothetical protein
MTQPRDIERLLDQWFADGSSVAPDRVVDIVADRIGRQPQRPAWRLDWRHHSMTTTIKLAAAIAAIAVLGVIGYTMLPGSPTGVGGPAPSATPAPSPSPSASASPSTSPSASAVFPAWFTAKGDGAGILPAGKQTTRRFMAGSTLTVPGDWVNDSDNTAIYTLFPDTPANEAEYGLSQGTAQNIIFADTVEDNMFAMCDATGLFQGTTAAEVIDFLVTNEKLSTTEPVDVTIGGLSGRQIDVQLNPDWSDGCPLGPNDPPTRDHKDGRNRFIILDTPDGGSIGIAIGSLSSSEFEAFLAEAMPIVNSLQIKP